MQHSVPQGTERSARAPSERAWIWLGVTCLIALALRLVPVLVFPSMNQGDEIFQSIEQAHRAIFGSGIIPWEFRYGARSWLVPGALAGLMWTAERVGDGPTYYLPLIYGTLATLSVACVVCGFSWARRMWGTTAGLVAASAIAVSCDAIYFGARATSEGIGAHLLIVATYLAEPGYLVRSRWRLFAAGLLLGLAFAVRFHLGPAIGVVGLWTSARGFRERLPPLMAGAAITAGLAGLLDAVTWSYPFESAWRNFEFNLTYSGSNYFGEAPWYKYFYFFPYYWAGGVAVLALLSFVGGIRKPILLAAAATIFITHQPLAHKEFRLIYPAIIIVVVLAALGTAEIVAWTGRNLKLGGMRDSSARLALAAAAICLWIAFSAGESLSQGYATRWSNASDELRASLAVARMPSACGVALYGVPWWQSGGYGYMHVPLRLYFPKTVEELKRDEAGFNTILYAPGPLPEGLNFTRSRCFNHVCLAERSGGCEPVPTISTPDTPPMAERFEPELRP